jgi:hypothetical protein
MRRDAVAVETNWRAGCGESRKSGSEGGGWKRAARCSTSLAAYPACVACNVRRHIERHG